MHPCKYFCYTMDKYQLCKTNIYQKYIYIILFMSTFNIHYESAFNCILFVAFRKDIWFVFHFLLHELCPTFTVFYILLCCCVCEHSKPYALKIFSVSQQAKYGFSCNSKAKFAREIKVHFQSQCAKNLKIFIINFTICLSKSFANNSFILKNNQ